MEGAEAVGAFLVRKITLKFLQWKHAYCEPTSSLYKMKKQSVAETPLPMSSPDLLSDCNINWWRDWGFFYMKKAATSALHLSRRATLNLKPTLTVSSSDKSLLSIT